MKEIYTLREFIRLTPPAKMRLMKRDPEQYKKLKAQSDKDFSIETDPEALSQVGGK